jgi:hypothetical protein
MTGGLVVYELLEHLGNVWYGRMPEQPEYPGIQILDYGDAVDSKDGLKGIQMTVTATVMASTLAIARNLASQSIKATHHARPTGVRSLAFSDLEEPFWIFERKLWALPIRFVVTLHEY